MTPFSGPSQRSWLSPTSRRQKRAGAAISASRLLPTSSGASARTAPQHSSLPRPMVKVMPYPYSPGESVLSTT
jgi:hypothetical protein